MINKKIESPCDIDSKSCQWECVEWFDDYGSLELWDLCCVKCNRFRDWSKKEFKESKLDESLVNF